MKNKLKYLPIIIIPFAISACSFSNIIVIKTIDSIEISDATLNYAYGDVYSEENQLNIIVNYKTGKKTTLSVKDVTLNLAVDGVTQDYNSAITNTGGAGKFTVSVTYEDEKSNVLQYNLLNEHIYVDEMSLSGPSEIDTFKSANLTLGVLPSNYTKRVMVYADKPNLVELTKNGNTISVLGKKSGTVNIIAASKKADGTEIKATHTLEVIATTNQITVAQTYNDFMKNNSYNVSACPIQGEPKLLVIPVWFNDSDKFITSNAKKDNVRSDIEKAYFGTTSETGWHSVSSYYEEESQGALKLTGTVSDWYEPGISYRIAGDKDYDMKGLVNNAVNWYFSNNPSDARSNYDSDGDKVLDGVMLIYAAPDCQQSGYKQYDNLWAYCFWIQPKTIPSGIYPNVYFWASYDFMYGKTNAFSETGTSFFNGDSRFDVDAHTYIHEMGHVFGLEDYYDYSDNNYCPAGGFSMQDYNVGGHDPFSVFALGWATAYVPTESVEITISGFQSNRDLILLSPNFNEYNSPFDEYLLLELYTPTGLNYMDSAYQYRNGYPQGPKQAGIRLWHVDARLATPTSSTGSTFKLAGSNVFKKIDFGYVHACSNTYEDDNPDHEDYYSVMGKSYYDFNILQLIRNKTTATYTPSGTIQSSDLFYEGDTFNMTKFSKQFKKGSLLNSGENLGWSFTVKSITEDTATITVTKN